MSFFKFLEKPFFHTRIKTSDVKMKEMALGYFVAPFCAMLSNSIFGAYLNRYYVDVIGWTKFGAFGSLLPLISTIFVVAGNLLVGQWIDQTRTSQGKARPYLFLSIPLVAAAVLLMFQTPKNSSPAVQMIWIAVTYNLYYSVAYPCFYTAHSSMVSLSTRDSDKRGLLATLSNASMVAAAGMGASVIAPILLQSYLFVTGANGLDVEASYAHWRVMAVILTLLTAFGIILEYFFTRERITEETLTPGQAEKKISAREHFQACVHSRYWWMMILFVFVFQMGQGIKNGTLSFYARWMFDSVVNSANPEAASGQLMSMLGLIGGIPSVIGMVIAWPVANKLGKKRAIVMGLIFALAGGLVCFLNVNSFPIVSTGLILKGIGIIPAQFVILALLSDVLDHLEAENGFRSDGFTMSIYGSIVVGLSGLCTALLNGLLTFSWYTNTGIAADPVAKMPIEDIANWTGQIVYRQYGGTEAVLAFLYLGMDMITFLISIFLLRRLDVEKHVEEDQKIIRERQKKER